MATPWTADEWERVGEPVVKRAKREVLADMAAGIIPKDARRFADLHDYVDANGYGGAFEELHPTLPNGDTPDVWFAFWGRVHDAVDWWLRAGRPILEDDFRRAGFHAYDTGGGCVAWRRELPDGREIWVTDDDATLPNDDTPAVVGVYATESDAWGNGEPLEAYTFPHASIALDYVRERFDLDG